MTKYLPIILCAWLATAQAATYYVSSSSGNDANPGTQAQPWAKAPGMLGFAGTYVHAAGDRIILKGGDTWTAQANCLWQWSNSGTFANPDYIGVDVTWFVGGSFTRPTIDGQWADFNTAGGSIFRDMFRPLGSNLQIDNIHWTRLAWNSNQGYQQVAYILENSPGNNTNFIVSNCVFDAWGHGPSATSYAMTAICGAQGEGFKDLGNMVTNCVFDGLTTTNSTDHLSTGTGCYLYGGKVVNCTFKNLVNTVLVSNNGATWCEFGHNNVGPIWNSFNFPVSGVEHDNGYRVPQGAGTIYVHDNYVHDTQSTCFFWGDSGEIEYAWNNVVWNVASTVFFIDPFSSSGGKTFAWNNTIVAGGQPLFTVPGRGPAHSYDTASSINNHLIGPGTIFGTTTTPLTHSTNLNMVSQSGAAATAQGYTLANLYQPTSPGVATYGAGQDVSASLAGTVTDILGVTRPQAGARWDSGAYEYVSVNAGQIMLNVGAQNVGENDGTTTITAQRSGGTTGAVSATVTTADQTAIAGHDYTTTTMTLNWADGATGARSFQIPILASGDTAITNRTFLAYISGITGGATIASPGTNTVTIIMNPPPTLPTTNGGTFSFAAASYATCLTCTNVLITVTRTGSTNLAGSVAYGTSDISAVAGTDYTTTTGSLIFGVNVNGFQTFTVPIINTGATGPPRMFRVILANPSPGANLGLATAIVSITQNGIISVPVTTTISGGVTLEGHVTIQGK